MNMEFEETKKKHQTVVAYNVRLLSHWTFSCISLSNDPWIKIQV